MKTSTRLVLVLTALAIVGPFFFKPSTRSLSESTDDVVIVITPHSETIRREIECGFCEWYRKRTGRTVRIDWRSLGSTGTIIRYINSTFENSFRNYWEQTLGRVWTDDVRAYYNDVNANTALGQDVRNAFLNSTVDCGIDVFYGGGVVEYEAQARLGHLVPCGLLEKHPEWFREDRISSTIDGAFLYDPKGVWFPALVSSFGLMYNTDRIRDLGVNVPTTWMDCADPKFYRQVAMVDPSQSSVVVKCLEMIIQQQIQRVRRELLQATGQADLTPQQLKTVLNRGWRDGWGLIQKIFANARYFTANSVTTIWDVNQGNCAVGVVVDFYGRQQRSMTVERGGKDRIRFVFPKNGSCWSPDPIALFRGAPHKDAACAFIEYVVSLEGQDRIGLKAGAPNGPQYGSLNLAPARKDWYRDRPQSFMASPDLNPFASDNEFVYQAAWTMPVFNAIRFLSKALLMHPYKELSKAWKAIIDARDAGRMEQADAALAVMQDFHELTYDWALEIFNPLFQSKEAPSIGRLETALTKRFYEQYRKAYAIAAER